MSVTVYTHALEFISAGAAVLFALLAAALTAYTVATWRRK